ncbi:MAG: T9SS type A sorting domain-containing protein [Bacteroidetes bacterium]|nr:T9SS type A sorting domain-containing protein [Bacteroidota bacterium]
MKIKNNKLSSKFQYSFTGALLILFLVSFSDSYPQAAGMWYAQSTNDTNYTYNSVYFANDSVGWVCGTHGKIFKTVNGGDSNQWNVQLSNSYQNYLQKIEGIQGSQNYVYACGYVNNSNPPAGVILQTNNGGTIWTNSTINYIDFKTLHFINAFTGFIVGGRFDDVNAGRIYKTTNAGQGATGFTFTTYTDNSVLTLGTFRAISFINTNTGWITATNSSNNTTLLKTTNMGVNWNVTGTTINGIYINDIKFINEQTGWACGGGAEGNRAKILKTTNGGQSWTIQTFTNSNMFKSMSWPTYFSTYRGFICGENGLVYVSYDLGDTWINQITPNINNLNCIYFPYADLGWAVGNNADVISTYHGGVLVNNISTRVPDSYNVYQNYPNPFNPTTTIKFDVIKSGNVRLEVFDGTGRKIEELVNENLAPGTYTTSWDAKGRSSGIYYYRISAGDFIKTMKMSLIK